MKKKFALGLLCLSLTIEAYELKVTKMSPDGELERSFVLTTPLVDKVVLDCQSFIQGLRLGEQEAAVVYMLEPYECEALQNRVEATLNRKLTHCIELDDVIQTDYICN